MLSAAVRRCHNWSFRSTQHMRVGCFTRRKYHSKAIRQCLKMTGNAEKTGNTSITEDEGVEI